MAVLMALLSSAILNCQLLQKSCIHCFDLCFFFSVLNMQLACFQSSQTSTVTWCVFSEAGQGLRTSVQLFSCDFVSYASLCSKGINTL